MYRLKGRDVGAPIEKLDADGERPVHRDHSGSERSHRAFEGCASESKCPMKVMTLCLLATAGWLPATPPNVDHAAEMWKILGGPEKEMGDPVQILENGNGRLCVSVQGRRGTVMRGFPATRIPATLTFRFQSTFDPQAREIPTKLFGTGDFRVFVGLKSPNVTRKASTEADLGSYEGFQFRVFPHLHDSPERTTTGDESHTATSLWIRYIDSKRRFDGMGLPHAGLMSDVAQNRNKQNGIHNCGWSRVSLNRGGFGLSNGEVVEITISITHEIVSIEAGGKRFAHQLRANQRRITRMDTIAVSHTNISRGYQTYRISDLRLTELPE